MKYSKILVLSFLLLCFSCNTNGDFTLEVLNNSLEPIQTVEFIREDIPDTLSFKDIAVGEKRIENYEKSKDTSSLVYNIQVTKADGSVLKARGGFYQKGLSFQQPVFKIKINDDEIITEWAN